jgi:hypothetical protein
MFGRSWLRFGTPKGFRAGLVIGVAVALVGLVVGTASGTATPFQNVIIVNPPASPVPVSLQGTGAISGSVSVTNLPATQPVSGTVDIGNLPPVQDIHVNGGSVGINGAANTIKIDPAANTVHVDNPGAIPLADKAFVINNQRLDPTIGSIAINFGRTINVTWLHLDNYGFSDTMEFRLETPAGEIFVSSGADGSVTQSFTVPVPATGVFVSCDNAVAHCDFGVDVLGT